NVCVRDHVEQRQAAAGIIVRNLDDQTLVGSDHESTRLAIAFFDLGGELNLLLRGQKRDLPDLAQVNLSSGIAIFSGHISSCHEKLGAGPTKCRLLCSWLAP